MIEENGRKKEVIMQHRNFKTLRSRWKRCIQKECMLFGLIFCHVKSIEKSGWQEEDYVNEALKRYKDMNSKNNNKVFCFWNVGEFLLKNQSFNS